MADEKDKPKVTPELLALGLLALTIAALSSDTAEKILGRETAQGAALILAKKAADIAKVDDFKVSMKVVPTGKKRSK